MAIAGFALFVMGIVFVIIAPINRRSNARRSEQAQGVLVDIGKRYNSKSYVGNMYYYSYFVDGIEYKIKSTVCSSQANKVGDSCTIWYNPKKPKDAQPFHYGSAKVYRVILIIGIIMIPLGFFMMGAGLSQ